MDGTGKGKEMNVGENIKRIRIGKGMSQADVAGKIGISQSGYGKFERSKSITLNTMRKISDALNITEYELLTGNKEMKPKPMITKELIDDHIRINPDKRMQQIADHYSIEEQLIQTMEECGELIQALSKMHRTKSFTDYEKSEHQVVGEMADVQIMLWQLEYLLEINRDRLTDKIGEKLERQLKRIEDEKNEI